MMMQPRFSYMGMVIAKLGEESQQSTGCPKVDNVGRYSYNMRNAALRTASSHVALCFRTSNYCTPPAAIAYD